MFHSQRYMQRVHSLFCFQPVGYRMCPTRATSGVYLLKHRHVYRILSFVPLFPRRYILYTRQDWWRRKLHEYTQYSVLFAYCIVYSRLELGIWLCRPPQGTWVLYTLAMFRIHETRSPWDAGVNVLGELRVRGHLCGFLKYLHTHFRNSWGWGRYLR